MSLINDALKRAQEAQSQIPPAPQQGPQLRPAEPTSYAWHGVGLMLPTALALVTMLVLFLFWEMSRQRGGQPQEVHATATPSPAPVTESAQPAEVPPPVAETAPRPPAPGTPQVVSDVTTNTPVVIEDIKPITPKLQAVIFNPRNPSAVINGRTVFRGDRLGGFRVTAITAESATLVGEGQ